MDAQVAEATQLLAAIVLLVVLLASQLVVHCLNCYPYDIEQSRAS